MYKCILTLHQCGGVQNTFMALKTFYLKRGRIIKGSLLYNKQNYCQNINFVSYTTICFDNSF